MRLRNPPGGNWRVDQTPDCPFRSPSSAQLNAVSPFCSFNSDPWLADHLVLLGALFDILDHVADGLQLLGVFVRNFDGKFFFKCHHQFDDIQGVGA